MGKAKTKRGPLSRIKIKRSAPGTAAPLAEIVEAAGPRGPVEDMARIEPMPVNANMAMAAWDGAKLVGVMRALTGFSSCRCVSDVGVRPSHQRRGIGRTLLDGPRKWPGDEVKVLLPSAEGAREFFPNVGGARAGNAFKVPGAR